MSAASFCRGCGKALSEEEKAIAGNVYCAACAPQYAQAPPPPGPSAYSAPPGYSASGRPIPGLAFALGFIPGVGAIYNGQYLKGLVHALVFGAIASGSDRSEALGFLVAAFVFYQAFEAYHTAQRRLLGEPVDEFSSLLARHSAGLPIGPVVLIVLGVVFLLSNLGLLSFDWLVRFWPVGLIVLGGYLLYERLSPPAVAAELKQLGGGSDESEHTA